MHISLKGFWESIYQSLPMGSGGKVMPADGQGIEYSWHSPHVEYLGSLEWEERVRESWDQIRGMSPATMWRTQPHLRTVVSFVARNIAHLGLHTYTRQSETDRVRDRSNRFIRAFGNPGDGMTSYDLIFALVGDMMLYDRAFWLPWTDKQGLDRIRRIPPSWVSAGKRNAFGTETYKIAIPGGGVEVPAERLIIFNGYSPTTLDGCSPPIEALKETLGEQMEATLHRAQVWKRGGRVSSVIERPMEAPAWTDDQAKRFREDWYANYTGSGPRAGGTPILEDGMTIKKIDLSAKDMQWAEGNKLSMVTVCGVYHVNPTMVGMLENANYSNVREFRRMLYGDTLGPYIAQYEGVINTFAIPYFGIDPERTYAEFNIYEKLQGSFEEQSAAYASAVGAPYMTRAEARARQNLPELEGADELIVPLNVLEGGQASPRDSGSQNEDPTGEEPDQPKQLTRGRKGYKTRASDPEERKMAEVVLKFFKRQEAAVRSKLGAKADDDWWDEDRWDSELATDLYKLAVMVSKSVAAKTLESIGFSPEEYDLDRTLAWLREVSERSATGINAATKAKIEAALEGDAPDDDLDSVFGQAEGRASMIAVSTATLVSGFAATESAKQLVGEDRATKTWIAHAGARPEHEKMSGETVLLSEDFSNGAAWPGDGGALGAEDIANCRCELEINIPGGTS